MAGILGSGRGNCVQCHSTVPCKPQARDHGEEVGGSKAMGWRPDFQEEIQNAGKPGARRRGRGQHQEARLTVLPAENGALPELTVPALGESSTDAPVLVVPVPSCRREATSSRCVGNGGRESDERKQAYEQLGRAEVADFKVQFGTDPSDPEAWRRLCETAEVGEIPEALDGRRQVCFQLRSLSDVANCRQKILGSHINFVDMLDARRRGTTAKIYKTEQELADYTKASGRFFRKRLAYESDLFLYLLREILSHYYGDRTAGVGSKRGVANVRVAPSNVQVV